MNNWKLKKIMYEKGISQTELASKIGITQASMSKKLRGLTNFLAPEISEIVEVLEIPKDEVYEYFLEQKEV